MLEAFEKAVSDCVATDEVMALFRAQAARAGFSITAFGAFVSTEQGPRTIFFFQNWPQDWLDLYARRNFVARDYVVAEARRRTMPFTFREAQSERRPTPGEQEVLDLGAARGWTDGFAVPMHGPGGYFGLVVYVGGDQSLDITRRNELSHVARITVDRCRVLSGFRLPKDTGAGLSERELECMRWISAGKTDAEAAALLKISAATVRFHVDGSRRKLGAKTRAQAVAMLLFQGRL